MREMQPSQRYRALKSRRHALTAFPAQRKKKERDVSKRAQTSPFWCHQSVNRLERTGSVSSCQIPDSRVYSFSCQKRQCTSWKTGSGFLEMRAENTIQSIGLDMETVVLDS